MAKFHRNHCTEYVDQAWAPTSYEGCLSGEGHEGGGGLGGPGTGGGCALWWVPGTRLRAQPAATTTGLRPGAGRDHLVFEVLLCGNLSSCLCPTLPACSAVARNSVVGAAPLSALLAGPCPGSASPCLPTGPRAPRCSCLYWGQSLTFRAQRGQSRSPPSNGAGPLVSSRGPRLWPQVQRPAFPPHSVCRCPYNLEKRFFFFY